MIIVSSFIYINNNVFYIIRTWTNYGCEVHINTDDISTHKGCTNLLKISLELGDIGGIFNLAGTLYDDNFQNQTKETFIQSFRPKAFATKHLSDLSIKLCPQLKYFVVFSSTACGRGNANQTNYAMANSIMERIIEQRVLNGLPGKAIQWGAIGEVGMVAKMAQHKIDAEFAGIQQQRIASCLTSLDYLITSNDSIVASMVVPTNRTGSNDKLNLLQTILNILGISDIKSVSSSSTLSDFGMDSLMTVEIKQMLEREFEIFLSNEELRSLTLGDIQKITEIPIGGHMESKQKDEIEILLNDLINSFDEKITLNIDAPEQSILQLNTLNNNVTDSMECLLIVPGIEGVFQQAWQSIAESLNIKTFFLQLTKSVQCTSITDICETFIKVSIIICRNVELIIYINCCV